MNQIFVYTINFHFQFSGHEIFSKKKKSLRLLFTTKANFFGCRCCWRAFFFGVCISNSDSVHRHFGRDCHTVCDFPCFPLMCQVNSHHLDCFHFCRKDKEQNVSIVRAFIYTIYGCFGQQTAHLVYSWANVDDNTKWRIYAWMDLSIKGDDFILCILVQCVYSATTKKFHILWWNKTKQTTQKRRFKRWNGHVEKVDRQMRVFCSKCLFINSRSRQSLTGRTFIARTLI